MRDVVIFGMGQVAEVIHHYLTEEGGRTVVAFTVDAAFRTADEVLGVPVVDFEDIERRYPPETHEMFVAVSFKGVNKLREAKVAEAEGKGYALTSHLSPRASAWSKLVMQPNTIIMENNVIQPFVTIGRNVIMWSGNHIGHHSRIGDNCFIASHAVISGNCEIGAGTFIGVNATLRDNINIGARNVIGAGTLILQSSADNAVFVGPATQAAKVTSDRLRSI
ncbi:MAG TPA: acetyltransferase [Phenylobacterium sp.]|jgi:sugar O-acyltransferase (sialic acid O-acetyltransferase NeuD family)|uniref:acetyltransferase n=1 Tax=Phenylobacterium sp. TaxID=1871053 RepID=UPI002C69D19B|nr:acetyltransferase [Phenylobacterium sp.]HXA41127.1 acetyltransferase [Phenylobacterium sp.]